MSDKKTQPSEQAAIDLDKLEAILKDALMWVSGATCEQRIKSALSLIRSARQAAPEAPTATHSEIYTLRRLIECAEKLDARPRPMCRDCADENGTCPNSGLECDMRKLFADAKSLHNRLASTGAAPEVPDSEQEAAVCARCGEPRNRHLGMLGTNCRTGNVGSIFTPAATVDAQADTQQVGAADCKTCGGSQSVSDPKGWQFERIPCPNCQRAPAQQTERMQPSREAVPLDRAWALDLLCIHRDNPDDLDPDSENRVRDVLIGARTALAQQGAAQAAHAGADTERDAARYRFLRKGFGDYGPDVDLHNGFVDGNEKMDAAIDAAMSSATDKKEQK